MPANEDILKEMTELLLSKATMLQYHCGDCKSPLFEKDGRVICPKCGPVRVMEEEEKKERPPGPSATGDSTVAILEKKRTQLLADLEAERDPKKITALLEAIDKLNSMLG
jgi:UPF0148 protein